MAVSYTHLDVYKRQEHSSVSVCGKGKGTERAAPHSTGLGPVYSGAVPVSYTHLDVYKRQALWKLMFSWSCAVFVS